MKIYQKLKLYAGEKIGYAYCSIFLSFLASLFLLLPYWLLWGFLKELILVQNIKNVRYYATWIVIFMMIYGIFYFLSLWCSHLLAFRLETNLRKEGIKHLLNASFSFFEKNSSGKIRKLIDDNASETHTIVAHLLPDLVGTALLPLGMVIIFFRIDIILGCSLLLMIGIGIWQLKDMMGEQEFMKTYMISLEKMNAEAVEYVRGMQVIKIFNTTIQSFKAFYDAILSYSNYALHYSMSCRRAYVWFQVLFHLFITFPLPIAILFMRHGANEKLVLVKIIFYVIFAGLLFLAFMRVMYVGMYHFQALEVISKLEALFDEMERNKVKYGNLEEVNHFDLEFKKVSFCYEEQYVCKELSFQLKEKKIYALVGSSGGGKSTIAKLLSGFYSVQEGEILLGGKNIKEYSETFLSKHIAFVFQNSKLWKKTIFENVKMGREDASYEEVMKALEKAQCEDILNKFEERENTLIGAKGVYLSGGEIQRIAIARAILKNADIVILDEASAAADPENEYELQRAFSNLMKDKTVIMIAHRLSSIQNVDEILVIDQGSIIERGNHKELMANKSRYADLQKFFSEANDWRIEND